MSNLPIFVAHCLFDGDCYPFHEFILNRIHVLGAAWGEEVLGRRPGHANESDEIYRAMRSEDRARKDRELAEQHAALVQEHGSERNLWIFQAGEYARHLGLSREDLPCIACEAGVGSRSISLLRIRPEWYATDARQQILSEALRTGLGSGSIRRLFPSLPIDADEMTQRMQRHLDGLRTSIERQMRGVLEDATRPIDEGWLQTEIANRALVVDRSGSRAFVFARAFSTAPLSFRLLVALAERGSSTGAFLSRKDAADRLWSGESRSLSAFDCIVHKLRQDLVHAVRLGGGDRTFVLETRRQRGYRLTLGPDDILVV